MARLISLVLSKGTGQWLRNFGVGLGGMTCCMLGILLILGTELSPEFHTLLEKVARALWLDQMWNISEKIGPVDNLKQLFLVIGAALLCRAAFDRGKEGRLFQTLEAELVIFGLLFYFPIPATILLCIRLTVTAIGGWMLYSSGFLSGKMNKIGALGLEALGVGYSFGSNEGMFIGGVLLTIYCADGFFREQSFLNALWLGLNGPFAGVSLALCVIPYLDTFDHKLGFSIGCLLFSLFLPFILVQEELNDLFNKMAVGEGAIIITESSYPGAPPFKRAVCPCCRRDWVLNRPHVVTAEATG